MFFLRFTPLQNYQLKTTAISSNLPIRMCLFEVYEIKRKIYLMPNFKDRIINVSNNEANLINVGI